MKVLPIIVLLFFPVAALAQGMQQMSDQDVQKMMQQAQEYQACIQRVDKEEIRKFQQQAMELNDEIKALCDSGDRDKAQEIAMKFGKESENNPVMQAMQECEKLAPDMSSDGPQEMEEEIDYSKEHVCDSMEE